jgi:hypothetical protein
MQRAAPEQIGLEPSANAASNALQELVSRSFAQMNQRLDVLSCGQKTLQDNLDVFLQAQNTPLDKKEDKLTTDDDTDYRDCIVSLKACALDTSPGLNAYSSACQCGNEYLVDEVYCRKCGLARPEDQPGRKISSNQSYGNHSQEEFFQVVSCFVANGTKEDAPPNYSCRSLLSRFQALNPEGKEAAIDTVMGGVIILCALCIGISMDSDKSVAWIVVDLAFSVVFVLELLTKVQMFGLLHHYCGPSKYSNIFDSLLIFIDLLQLMIQHTLPDMVGSGMNDKPSASLLRMIRLCRLVRLLRLLRSPIFKDLFVMTAGMIGGATTLIASIFLFAIFVYVVSIVFRELFGRQDYDNVKPYFDSVPRAMFTVFRCSFGDCATKGGVPIFEWVHEHYGATHSFLYCLLVFIVTIGLFNVISAIFVESTMSAAAANEQQMKKDRMADQNLWNSRISIMTLCLLEASDKIISKDNIDKELAWMVTQTIGPEMFSKWIEDKRVMRALEDLDIHPDDHARLFDILDADNTGSMSVNEILDGIMRLRGDPRRSDIVCVDLMVRSIQRQCQFACEGVSRLTGVPMPDF